MHNSPGRRVFFRQNAVAHDAATTKTRARCLTPLPPLSVLDAETRASGRESGRVPTTLTPRFISNEGGGVQIMRRGPQPEDNDEPHVGRAQLAVLQGERRLLQTRRLL